MKSIFGILLILFTATTGWAQKFCTCQLERLTGIESDTIVYRASVTVFPEALVQEIFFGIIELNDEYFIEPDIIGKQYVYNTTDREVGDNWRSYGRAANLRHSLLTILSEDIYNVHCDNIYLDNQTHDFTTILSSVAKP